VKSGVVVVVVKFSSSSSSSSFGEFLCGVEEETVFG
jgi:hypothetical protein